MPAQQKDDSKIPVRAAVRFPLRLEFTIRTDDLEIKAISEDVSSTGILFQAAALPPVNSRVEFLITMPAAILGGTEDVLLQCVGHIVRHQRTAEKNMAAAVIDEYSLKAGPHED